MKAISFENAEFSYRPHQPILKIKEFSVLKGESVFIYGPSGSGKTTLLGLATGILVPTKGNVHVLGRKLEEISSRARDHMRANQMGYIFQQFNLIPYLSVLENISLSAWVGDVKRAQIEKSVDEEAKYLADRLGLNDSLHKNVLELSVGQQQRVAVARALMGPPELIVADEPTSALDTDRQRDFIELFLERTKEAKATVLFVSHNKALSTHFDRTVSLSDINEARL